MVRGAVMAAEAAMTRRSPRSERNRAFRVIFGRSSIIERTGLNSNVLGGHRARRWKGMKGGSLKRNRNGEMWWLPEDTGMRRPWNPSYAIDPDRSGSDR